MVMKMSRLALVCLCLAALVCAPANAQSKRVGAVSPSAVYARIIQLEDERNLNGDELLGLLKHRSAVVRERAALAIGRIGDKRGTDALIALLEHDDVDSVRAMTAFALGEVEDAQAISTLMAVVERENESMTVRARAAEALGKIASVQANTDALGKNAVERINQSLIAQLLNPNAALSRDQKLLSSLTIAALMRLRNPSSVEPLVQQLKSKDAEVRAQVANALARLRQPIASAIPALIEALQDQEEETAIAKLKAALDDSHGDASADARANAARALGVSKDALAVEPLLKALQDKIEHVQVNAVRALAAIGDRRAVEPLIELAKLSDPKATLHRRRPPSFNLMLECVVALGTLKDERALPFLRELRMREGAGAYPELEIAMGRFGAAAYFSPSEDLLNQGANNPKSLANLAQGIGEAGSELGKELLLALWMANYLESPAQPQILRSLARLKPVSLPFILREAVRHKDVFVRATAAALIEEMVEENNLNVLVRALAESKDDKANDAKLVILTALSKYKSEKAIEAIKTSLDDRDHLVRRHAVDLLRQMGAGDFSDRIGIVQTGHDKLFYQRVAARQNKKITATIHTAKGRIKLELFPQDAPGAVDSFITLARKGFFNNLTFHRVVPNFVIQGGDPRGDGEGGPGYQIRCEINQRPYTRGAVGMALSGKDTGGSQFFITHSPQPHLDGGYTVFGQVTSGMEVVDRIARGDLIKKVEIVETSSRP
jgi:cyclophilin family peptidyl-prolyl cis-trans isomerase/HEAT repeat protein